MGELFKALSAGFARFVFAWITPSLVSLGLVWLIVLPVLPKFEFLQRIVAPGKESGLAAASVFAFLVVVSAILFAYASLPIYRVLEGYRLPAGIRRRQLRRHRLRLARLQAQHKHAHRTGRDLPLFVKESLDRYPDDVREVRATSLGNALAGMESYSLNRFGFDSQRMWYELLGVAKDNTRHDTEEGRSPVDFFVSSVMHLILLGLLSIGAAFVAVRPVSEMDLSQGYIAAAPDWPCLVLSVGAFALVPLAYHGAVVNVADWAATVKALVNLNRVRLADELGLQMPATLFEERDMWTSYMAVIEEDQPKYRRVYDSYRKTWRD